VGWCKQRSVLRHAPTFVQSWMGLGRKVETTVINNLNAAQRQVFVPGMLVPTSWMNLLIVAMWPTPGYLGTGRKHHKLIIMRISRTGEIDFYEDETTSGPQ